MVRPREDNDRHPAGIPRRSPVRQQLIPQLSRRRPPEAPAGTRQSPQDQGTKALLARQIPARSRLGRKYQDRPVTPEVAVRATSLPLNPCKLAECVVGSDARLEPTTQTFFRSNPKGPKTARKPERGSRFQADSERREARSRRRRATTRSSRRSTSFESRTPAQR
jgi:hypothetical protein